MLFNSFEFVWLLPLFFLTYYLVAKKGMGNAWLLLISYGLYLKWKPVYALVLLWVTVVTYTSAIFLSRKSMVRGRRKYFVIGTLFTLLPLCFFKYYNFLNATLTDALSTFGWNVGLSGLNWALPLGISFYTFQAVGYLADVYHGHIECERNWWNYMLFVSFFPQIASGPISKAEDLLPQIKAERPFRYEQAVLGLKWILWGMFMKVVMADRLGIYADTIFNNYEYQSGLSCWIGSFLYTMQIYGDFAGYSFMALGVGKLFGFELVNNFRRPYFSQSITEFWHRWHISLSTWLKDYIYIPLGGNRCSKSRNYWNIFVSFLVSGIWHGANWTFIVWGMMHGVFQIIEKMMGLNKVDSKGFLKCLRVMVTFILINMAWVFFRMPTLGQAKGFLVRMLTNFDTGIAEITPAMILFILMSLTIVVIKDTLDEFAPKHYSLFHCRFSAIRWTIYIILLCLILTCGVFDTSQFIYVNF